MSCFNVQYQVGTQHTNNRIATGMSSFSMWYKVGLQHIATACNQQQLQQNACFAVMNHQMRPQGSPQQHSAAAGMPSHSQQQQMMATAMQLHNTSHQNLANMNVVVDSGSGGSS